jgi:hypothetical protein
MDARPPRRLLRLLLLPPLPLVARSRRGQNRVTHRLRMDRDNDKNPWWTCDHCGDKWGHVPSDVCVTLLAKLHAEETAGWNTVTPPTGDVYELVRIIANAARRAA